MTMASSNDSPLDQLAALNEQDTENVVYLKSSAHGTSAPGPVLTYDEIKKLADDLSSESGPENINVVLAEITRTDLDHVSARKVLDRVHERTNLPISDLKRALKALATGGDGKSPDLGMRIADTVLDDYYAGGEHLIRTTDRRFWHYTGTHWKPVSDEFLFKRVVEVVEHVIRPTGVSYRSASEAAFKLLIARTAAEGDTLRLAAEPRPVINCLNYELWIGAEGEVDLRAHDPESRLTYCLDVEFKPDAQCLRYDEALQGIFAKAKDPTDMARHLNEIFGYAIQPIRDIPMYVLLHGGGDNGKTVLVQTITRLMGPTSAHWGRIDKVENNRFAIGSLVGKLLFVDDDVTTGTRLPDGFLKAISERKLLTGERKFKDTFEFVCVALPILLCNNFPSLADLSHGMLRRAYVVPFDRTFTDKDRDPHLFSHIWAHEMSGVLNRALEGLRRLRKQGRFKLPVDCERAYVEWLAAANPLFAFIEERCVKGASERIRLTPLYMAFESWADQAGVRRLPSRILLKSNLENLGYKVRKVKGYSEVVSLCLKNPLLPEPNE